MAKKIIDPEFIKSCYELPEEWKKQMATPEYNERIDFLNEIDIMIKSLPEKHGIEDLYSYRGDEPPCKNNPVGKFGWYFIIKNGEEYLDETCFSFTIEAPKIRTNRNSVVKEITDFSNNFISYYNAKKQCIK